MKWKIVEWVVGRFNGNNKYVLRNECHVHMEQINKRIDDTNSHMDERFDDLKDFIKVINGKQ